ncbi:MAG: hypothetical protein ACT4O9_12685 [Blastocatellia bacterium]
MRNKLFAFVAAAVLVLNFTGSLVADSTSKTLARARLNQLVAVLPQSDAIVTIDIKRFFGEALPKLLSGNQKLMSEVMACIEEMKSTTGIEIRQFDHVAAGMTIKKSKEKEYDFEPVITARGDVSSSSVIENAKKASGGKYKEERVGSRVVFIFAAKKVIANTTPATVTGKDAEAVQKAVKKLSDEIALTAVDANTVAFGTPARVREIIEAKTKISSELTGLLNRKEIAVVNMAAKVPSGMSTFLPLENDELGQNIDSIQYVFGNMDVVGDQTMMSMTARTQQISQAKSLQETLEGLQSLGKALLGGSKRADQQVYARLIENVKFSRSGTEINMDLAIAQSDVDALVAMIKK